MLAADREEDQPAKEETFKGQDGGVDVKGEVMQLGAGDEEKDDAEFREGAAGASAPVEAETAVNALARQILS